MRRSDEKIKDEMVLDKMNEMGGIVKMTELYSNLDFVNSIRNARYRLSNLQDRGYVEKIGKGKNTKWKLIPEKYDDLQSKRVLRHVHAQNGVTNTPYSEEEYSQALLTALQ